MIIGITMHHGSRQRIQSISLISAELYRQGSVAATLHVQVKYTTMASDVLPIWVDSDATKPEFAALHLQSYTQHRDWRVDAREMQTTFAHTSAKIVAVDQT